MLKKFLGIFKRDKSQFSEEELRWQLKCELIILLILTVIWMGSIVLFDMNFFEFLLGCIVWFIIYIFICMKTISSSENELRQRKIEKILKKIKNQDLSNLIILDEGVYFELIQECIKVGIIKISYEFDEVKILITTTDVQTFIPVKKEEILKYFKLEE